MRRKNRSNLTSPQRIGAACNLADLDQWFRREAVAVETPQIRDVVLRVHEHLDAFVRWPTQAQLLWEGCDRNTKYHTYPPVIASSAKVHRLRLDGRVNGPAIAAYRLAGGERPPRFGSNNAWSVHHLYSGKFPYFDREETLHAAYDGRHCTQSAGLVAIHPVADQMCDEYPFFAWLLRAKSFLNFGYDPDGVFSDETPDGYGFIPGDDLFLTPRYSIMVGAQTNV